jgi:hypothetical protein
VWRCPPLPLGLGVYTLAIRLTTHGARTHGEPPSHAEVRALTMYGVLDAPQGTTWIGALDVATSWAQGAGSPREAARMLTRALHDRGTYRGGHAYTRDFGRGDRWQQRFYLREFLLDPAFPRGQCDEFSAFLQVLLEASGIADARVQRSGPAEGLGFRTHAIALAGSAELRARLFTYHQYVVSGAEIYDAAVRFAAVDDDTAPLTPARYRERLVDGVLLRSGVLGCGRRRRPFGRCSPRVCRASEVEVRRRGRGERSPPRQGPTPSGSGVMLPPAAKAWQAAQRRASA